MASTAQVIKDFKHCVQCYYLKEFMSKFKFNHLICKEFLCLLLVEHEFNYTKNSSDIFFSV